MPRKKATTSTGADQSAKASTAGKTGSTGTKRGPGQPRKIQDAEALARVVDDYINYNISRNENDINPPTDYDFCSFAGISSSTLDNYKKGDEDTYPGYLRALKKLTLYREQYFVKLSVTNPKAAGAAIFALKQPKNGGYMDKPVISVEARELKIVHGEGMKDDSFK